MKGNVNRFILPLVPSPTRATMLHLQICVWDNEGLSYLEGTEVKHLLVLLPAVPSTVTHILSQNWAKANNQQPSQWKNTSTQQEHGPRPSRSLRENQQP